MLMITIMLMLQMIKYINIIHSKYFFVSDVNIMWRVNSWYYSLSKHYWTWRHARIALCWFVRGKMVVAGNFENRSNKSISQVLFVTFFLIYKFCKYLEWTKQYYWVECYYKIECYYWIQSISIIHVIIATYSLLWSQFNSLWFKLVHYRT